MAGCISQPRSSFAAAGAWALLAGAVCSAAPAAGITVREVRFWSLGEVTRVAIEVSADFKYRYDRLPGPDRLFFDIEGARPENSDKKIHVIAVGDPLLKQIRVAETQPSVTRVVLDLEPHDPPVQFTASQLSQPDRLMIELRLKDKPLPPASSSVTGSTVLHQAPASASLAAKPAPRRFDPPALAPASPPLLAEQPQILNPASAPVLTAPVRSPLAAASLRTNLPPLPSPATPKSPPATPLTPQPAKRIPGDESLTRVLGLKLGRVVIDPGHGGHDTGTHGPSGLTEKEVVLDIAKRVGALLESRLHSEVVYTRDDDTFIPLEERTRIANEHKADLFLSIHANSSPIRGVSGVETYYLNFTTSKTALELAARENASSESSIFDLQDMLQKIARKDKIDESREFATRVQNALFAVSQKSNSAAKNRGVKKAPFVVLIGASMPSILAEIGFLTNASDEALLRKPEQRQRIAEALYKGVASYADSLSHFTVAQRE